MNTPPRDYQRQARWVLDKIDNLGVDNWVVLWADAKMLPPRNANPCIIFAVVHMAYNQQDLTKGDAFLDAIYRNQAKWALEDLEAEARLDAKPGFRWRKGHNIKEHHGH